MTQLEALQKNLSICALARLSILTAQTFQFHNNPDIIDWEYDHEKRRSAQAVPFDEKDFNPTAPDYCKQWAKIAKSAGRQFAALTSKHHEGFDLWPLRLYRSLCEKCDKQNRCRCRLSGRVPRGGELLPVCIFPCST